MAIKLRISVAVGSLALIAPALAADLFGSAPPLSFPASQAATAIEVGTNWYIRGEIGASFDHAPTLSTITLPTLPPGLLGSTSTGGSSDSLVLGVGAGYRFNNFLRFEGTWDYREGPSRSRSLAVVCPYGLTGVSSALGAGYLYNPSDSCFGATKLTQQTNTFLANAFVDLGTYGGFTPYVGAGLGLSVTTMRGSTTFTETANGLPYLANLTSDGGFPSVWVNSAGIPIAPQPGVAFALQNWSRSISSTTYRPAWALSVGFGYQLTPSATLDVGYRFVDGGQASLLVNPQTGLTIHQNNNSQQVLVGVRYLLN
jgi:opacity protein-like surface antigen